MLTNIILILIVIAHAIIAWLSNIERKKALNEYYKGLFTFAYYHGLTASIILGLASIYLIFK